MNSSRSLDGSAVPASERSASQLDDQEDRDELRDRYYGILQELRVILPGVQVLVAFLLTVPFSQRFEDLDPIGRSAYLAALLSGLVATVCFIAPTAQHRTGPRSARSIRVTWAVRMTRAGLLFTSISLVAATYCVTRFVFADGFAAWVTAGLTAVILSAWVVLPRWVGLSARGSSRLRAGTTDVDR